ncbi:hypothetical protein PHMEG_00037570 [Phytophthora megakarya]|uniref:RNase H type-1 domain-containing protein n=1 Tax=Phytophthora megakarya TaxID=4795 RepID=A0A225UJN4_9STRA|nr:hypothetical protein PHMEG_00037570 [Phytophthora megakarya]
MDAQGFILDDVTVNDAEYCGLLNGLTMAQLGAQSNLQMRLAWCEALKAQFDSVRLVHVKRDFSQVADYLTSKTLLLGRSWSVQEDGERQHLERVFKIQEKLMNSAEGHLGPVTQD